MSAGISSHPQLHLYAHQCEPAYGQQFLRCAFLSDRFRWLWPFLLSLPPLQYNFLVFTLPVGKLYSIALFQDIDSNTELNTKGAMKVADEPIGFSNNKLGRFDPPGFDKTSFKLINDTTLKVHIISSRKEYFKRME